MELKLCLCFLMLWFVGVTQPASDQWMIDVPSNIPAVHRSCVVIPCRYYYPRTKRILNRRIGFWKRGNRIVSTNLPKWKLTKEFDKRTKFVGKFLINNCSMLLDSVRTTDVGPFYFRIQMPRYNSFTFSENTVTIDVIRFPDPPTLTFKVLDKVTAYCSVFHSCPAMPPRFSWSRSGYTVTWSKQVNNWMWRTESVLEFSPNAEEFGQPLNCSVVYRGGKTVESSVILIS